MKFGRSRKFYLLISFGFVLILFFFSHWKTFKILDQSNDKNFPLIQEMRSGRDEKTREEKCSPENGVQTSGHCLNKGDNNFMNNLI